ncbi:MAG: M23 family metallopeptidase [Deltaproteobacteria bacterium]|nr:MAG: M23 family metallopeptidase [Deltaproteobacteria bacterium]
MSKRFTILIIPEGSHRVRRFALQLSAIKWSAAGVACCVLLVIGLAVYAVKSGFDRREFERLREQSRVHQQEMDQLVAKLEDLRKELLVMAQNDAKLRIMNKLTKPKTENLDGVGGPAVGDGPVDKLSSLQDQIDNLRREVDLRRVSQEEIQGFLNDQRSLLGSRPAGWPVRGWVTSDFGVRRDPFDGQRRMHEGLDIATRTGTPVMTTAAGIVREVGTEPGYGKLVVIDHGHGFSTAYGHNSRILVKIGQRVKRGEVIATAGNTGRSSGPHVHYEVRVNGVPVNPDKYL